PNMPNWTDNEVWELSRMTEFERARRDKHLAEIDAINERLTHDLASEKWWHLYARGALGVALTLAVLLFVQTYL
ncbi:MAG: hypothetical protein AAFO73_05450, partial [Pseudomonadota bacterium]